MTSPTGNNIPASSEVQPASEPLLPVVRSPMLDRSDRLFAYELLLHRDGGDTQDPAELAQRMPAFLADGALQRLVRGNRAFLRLPSDLPPDPVAALLQHARLGLVLAPEDARNEALRQLLPALANRGCPLLLDLGERAPDAELEPLLRFVQYARVDARGEPQRLLELCRRLQTRCIEVIAGHVDDHALHARCMSMPLQAVQGRYLLQPEQVEVPVLAANRLSLLRLMSAVEQDATNPVELGEIVRDDATLSYKLLGCVNSTYFALPRELKSVQQAAIFFGLTRMRNWIYTMALGGMDDRPPELLRTALIRAHMCEKLAWNMPAEQREMAFTAGLFSLLDTLMGAPMSFVLTHLALAPDIRAALVGGQGPYGPLLEQIRQWESGEAASASRRIATIYLEAAQWADHVYTFANAPA
jgi:EAL and modified HD-GYP domain-containing signal transduction protein